MEKFYDLCYANRLYANKECWLISSHWAPNFSNVVSSVFLHSTPNSLRFLSHPCENTMLRLARFSVCDTDVRAAAVIRKSFFWSQRSRIGSFWICGPASVEGCINGSWESSKYRREAGGREQGSCPKLKDVLANGICGCVRKIGTGFRVLWIKREEVAQWIRGLALAADLGLISSGSQPSVTPVAGDPLLTSVGSPDLHGTHTYRQARDSHIKENKSF